MAKLFYSYRDGQVYMLPRTAEPLLGIILKKVEEK